MIYDGTIACSAKEHAKEALILVIGQWWTWKLIFTGR
jgi:hypothetical protein